MKKFVGLLIVLSLTATVHAGLDIGFSSDNGGHWSYEASDDIDRTGTFSFTQPIGIDTVQGIEWNRLVDAMVDLYVHIPKLSVSLNESPIYPGLYKGVLTPVTTTVEIKNEDDIVIFTGELSEGDIFVNANLLGYKSMPQISNITFLGWSLPINANFNLALVGGELAGMILNNQDNPTGSSFSGSITPIPEPATFFILALGSVLLLKKE